MINTLATYIQERLKQPLPALKAHIEMMPYRTKSLKKVNVTNAVPSSVLVLLYPNNNGISLVLMQRNTYKGIHSDQISFPGGKQEPMDEDSYATALREANEEIGIVSNEVRLLGKLTEVYIPPSNFNVTPIVGSMGSKPIFLPDEREVKRLIEIDVKDLLDPENKQDKKVRLNTGLKMDVPSFVFNQEVVWGATASILNELRYLLEENRQLLEIRV